MLKDILQEDGKLYRSEKGKSNGEGINEGKIKSFFLLLFELKNTVYLK